VTTKKSKLSFRDALLAEVAASPNSVHTRCAICDSPNKVEIEQAYTDGAKYRLIGRTLQRLGEMPKNVSIGTISDRVSTHFRDHVGADNVT